MIYTDLMTLASHAPNYTIEDYLQWEGDWELWDGRPVAMSPAPFRPHAKVGARLLKLIGNQLDLHDECDECEVLYEMDWHVSEDTVVRPDIVICCDQEDQTWLTKAPELIIEILSPSTRKLDLTAKKELYSREGVPLYFIADPENRRLTKWRLVNEHYEVVPEGGKTKLHGDCELELLEPDVF
ncbi:MAG: Uma2 family endonuclease [Verrucomicrobiota bacterium]